jgi:hypothetical protein
MKRRIWIEMFENRVLRNIFGPKREEMSRVGRKLHNEDLYNFFPE